MVLQKVKNCLMLEQNLRFHVIVILSFIQDHNWYKIDQSYRSHLIFIDLGSFDRDKLVADVFPDVEFAVGLQNVSDHLIIFSSQ